MARNSVSFRIKNFRKCYKQCFGKIKNGVFLRTEAHFFFNFKALRGYDLSMSQTKTLADAIIEITADHAI